MKPFGALEGAQLVFDFAPGGRAAGLVETGKHLVRAAEALAVATAIRRSNDIAIARAMLAEAGAPDEHPRCESENLSARARATLQDLSNGGFHGDAAV